MWLPRSDEADCHRRKDEGGNCVEVAACPGTVHIRDFKDKAGSQLAVAPGGADLLPRGRKTRALLAYLCLAEVTR